MMSHTAKGKQDQQPELTLEQLQANYDSLVAENQQLITEHESLQQENEKLHKTVARLQSSADNSDKFRDQLVALKSDFDSYKKRMRNDVESSIAQGKMTAVESILPILDTFDIAQKHLDDTNREAFEMVQKQFVSVLIDLGVEPLEAMGLDFDPNTMNALSSIDRGEDNKGKVVEVYQKGYRLAGKIIRYSQVIVGA